jgi:ribosomal protein S18 acetylase RimI-like enzyme
LTVEAAVVIINSAMPDSLEFPTTKADAPLRKLVLNEARAYAVFANGRVEDHQFAVSLVCEKLPQNLTFNRAYVLDARLLTAEFLEDITSDFISARLPFQMNVFLPVPDEVQEVLRQKNFTVTENYGSEMVLAKPSAVSERNPAVKVERVSQDLIETFSNTLLQAYSMPPSLIQTFHYFFRRAINMLLNSYRTPSSEAPTVGQIFCRTIRSALAQSGVRLYLAYLGSKPAGVLYLFSEGGVGGIYNVGVVSEARRQGVATALMLQAIEDSRAAGNSTLCLQTRANSFQERLYERLGFKIVARRNSVIQTHC